MRGNHLFLALSVPLALLAGAAEAADLPTKKPAPAPVFAPPPFSFTGPYVGAQGGYAWDGEEVYVPRYERNSFSIERTGAFGGLVAGYDYQFGNSMWGGGGVVAGVQADYNLSSATGSATPRGIYHATNKVNNFGSVDLKLGYAFGRFMVYGIGGLGMLDVNHTVSLPYIPYAFGSYSTFGTGFNIGGGVEYAFTDNWIGFIDYKHYRNPSTWYSAIPVLGPHSTTETLSIVRAGVGYKF